MRSRIFYLAMIGLTMLLAAGCGSQSAAIPASPAKETLTVFAAASLTEPFTAIASEFEASHAGLELVLNFAGSQALRLQIEQGARFDIFASADERHMEFLAAAGLVPAAAVFAKNQLVVIVPAANPADITSLVDLGRPGLKLVLAAAPVPAGRYARQTLAQLDSSPEMDPGYSTRVLANLVSEEDNVKGVLAKVRLGEADAGLVYASDVTPAVAAELGILAIPPAYNVEASYPIGTAAASASPELAQQFVDFVLSPRGQSILYQHGFQPVNLEAMERK